MFDDGGRIARRRSTALASRNRLTTGALCFSGRYFMAYARAASARLLFGAVLALAVCGQTPGLAAPTATTNVTTYHYDNLRTGWNPTEKTLTPGAVQNGAGGGTFKMTQFVQLDDQVDAQPLLMTGQHVQGHGTHDVVYVATENNTLYAIDANSGKILLQRNFGPPVPIGALPGGCNNNANNVGIGGTPVIDATNGVMYVIAYTYTDSVQKYELHKIDLSSLKDVVPRIVVQATGQLTSGHHYHFTAAVSRQRAALLLANGNVYAGFASFCDVAADQSRGWILGWNAGTLTPLAANELNNKLATSPDDFFLSSIWMSGYGLAASAAGDIYFVTGNSDYSGTTLDPVNNIGESAVQMSGDLTTVKSVFTPDNATDLENGDVDFGSGGLMLLPPQPGQNSNLAVAAGKDNNMYFLNADNLNNNTTGEGRILGTYGIGGCWCGESYFTAGNSVGRVVTSGGNAIGVWAVKGKGSHPALTNEYFGPSITGDQDPGFLTAVSSNGSNSVVIWAVSRPNASDSDSVSLYAFNEPTGAQIFSGVAGYWPNTGGNANIAPVVANGHVYVASYAGLAIYGLSSGAAATAHLPAGGLPAVKRVALAPGQHEIFGIVKAMNGWSVTVAKRDGTLVNVDTLAAAQSKNFAEPRVGHGILVRGKYTGINAMTADVVLHAKDHAGMWQPDR
jgi:hypothetical protein